VTVYINTVRTGTGIHVGGEDGFIIRNLPQGFNASEFQVGSVIPFLNGLSWKSGDEEKFEDAIILTQGGFEARLTLCAWRGAVGYYFTTEPRPASRHIRNTGLPLREVARLQAIA